MAIQTPTAQRMIPDKRSDEIEQVWRVSARCGRHKAEEVSCLEASAKQGYRARAFHISVKGEGFLH